MQNLHNSEEVSQQAMLEKLNAVRGSTGNLDLLGLGIQRDEDEEDEDSDDDGAGGMDAEGGEI
jgi:hypothetical protein